jgi:cytochrome c peroxidase
MKVLLLSAMAVLASVRVSADDTAPRKDQVQAALNKTDVGFFLLLDKNDKAPTPKETQDALNKTDVGFFLLLDKNDKAPAPKETQDALNKTDVGFFLLLDKNDKAPAPKETQAALNKTDVGFFLLLDKNDKAPAAKQTQEALNKTDVGFFLLLDKKPADSADEVELGRKLFFDPRLSANKTMACASCHNPSMAWRDGLPRARGLNGVELPRRTPTLLNVHHEQQRFFWDGRASSVEEASLTALQSRLEMNRDPQELVKELNRIPEYSHRFVSVYGPVGITPQTIAKAVATFVKAEIRPAPTPFDRFRHDPDAMSPAAQRGLVTFTGKGRCVLCHTGPGLSNAFFHNTGVKPIPGVEDVGRYAVVPNKNDYRAFKTMPLRNVALTAPYMHNGSLKTLRDVVDFYDRGGDVAEGRDPLMQPLGLSELEKDDLVAFLNALTSPQAPVAVPNLPMEAEAPTVRVAALWNVQRARMIEYDLEAKDRAGLAANALAMRENVEAARKHEGVDLTLTGACLDETFDRALSAEHAASATGPWTDAEREAKPLAAVAQRCASLLSSSGGLAAADRLLGDAEASIEKLAAASREDRAAGERCDKEFTVGRFLSAVADKKIPEASLEKVRPLVINDLLAAHQYRAFVAKDPTVCDALAPMEKHYFGINRTAPWGCREWYWDMAAANALTTKNGKFEDICRHSVAHDYPGMNGEDGMAICGVIARHIDEPEKMCRALVPRYLGMETVPSCVNEFARYSRDADVGKTQNGVPDQLYKRYVALDLYVRAYNAKDIAVCGDSELCRVLMGDGDKIAKTYEDKVRGVVCAAAAAPTGGLDPAKSAALLDQGGDLLARAEDGRPSDDRAAARQIDARQERLSRLRQRFDEVVKALPREDRQGSIARPDLSAQARAD